jgi:hypothetical protein
VSAQEPEATPAPNPAAPPKATGGLRTLAVLAALVLGLFSAVLLGVAIDNASIPTCDAVRSGDAEPTDNGDCIDGTKFQDVSSDVLIIGSAALLVLGCIAVLIFGITGRRQPWLRRSAFLLGAGVVLFGLASVISRV